MNLLTQMRNYRAWSAFFAILLGLFMYYSVKNFSYEQKDFSFIILPDTQWYSYEHPEILMSQMNWIKENHWDLNTKAVITLGDIVQSRNEEEIEWQRADRAYEILDDIRIPYNVLPGNHDISQSGSTELFNKYFPPERFNEKKWYGGNHDGTNRNNYITIRAGRIDFILVSLEYCPPDDAVSWAQDIFRQHPEKIGILATHAYLDAKGTQTTECKRSTRRGDNAGFDMWEKIVKPSDNVQIVMNGHFHHKQGGTYLTSRVGDRTIHQIMSNYQDFENGGNGFLRIFNFAIENSTVYVNAYSPYIDKFLKDPVNMFSFQIDLF